MSDHLRPLDRAAQNGAAQASALGSPLVLFHLSDIHFGVEDVRALAWVERCIAEENPAAILITGDVTMRARTREFAAASEWIASLGPPVTVEVGNHDMPYYNLAERFFTPYRRFHRIERLLERQLDLPGLAVVPLKTATRAQWRFPWSNGWVTKRALAETLAAIDAVPQGTRVLVTAHHPLTERSPHGKLLTINGNKAIEALAQRGVGAVLTGHVHDAFDLVAVSPRGPLRMIGAGTLSRRIRSTPCSFNQLLIGPAGITVKVRNLGEVPTPEMQIDAVPENAMPPRQPSEPVAPVGHVPAIDPPVR